MSRVSLCVVLAALVLAMAVLYFTWALEKTRVQIAPPPAPPRSEVAPWPGRLVGEIEPSAIFMAEDIGDIDPETGLPPPLRIDIRYWRSSEGLAVMVGQTVEVSYAVADAGSSNNSGPRRRPVRIPEKTPEIVLNVEGEALAEGQPPATQPRGAQTIRTHTFRAALPGAVKLSLSGLAYRPVAIVKVHSREEYEALPLQGVEGRVIQLLGDFMPSPEPSDPPRGRIYSRSVPIHIFRGRLPVHWTEHGTDRFSRSVVITPTVQTDQPHPQRLGIVQSDKRGQFRAILPPGEYTFVPEMGGELYLNSYSDGPDGPAWGSCQVYRGRFTWAEIRDTRGAVF